MVSHFTQHKTTTTELSQTPALAYKQTHSLNFSHSLAEKTSQEFFTDSTYTFIKTEGVVVS